MATIKQLEKEISLLKLRNKRVEADKAWETSAGRKIVVFVLTYAVVFLVFASAGIPNPAANSLVPAVAFFLSTLSLPFFKQLWLKRFYKVP